MNLTQVEREARKERKVRNGTKRKRAARWPAYTQAHSWPLTGERPKLPTQKAGGAAAWLRRAGPNSRQPTGSPLKTLGRRRSPHSRFKASPGDWGHFMKERLLINQMNYNLKSFPTTDKHRAALKQEECSEAPGAGGASPSRGALCAQCSAGFLSSHSACTTSPTPFCATLTLLKKLKNFHGSSFTTDIGCAVWNNINIPRSMSAAKSRKFFLVSPYKYFKGPMC